ncbi:MAG: chitobiase/beta-hexosaminidase C-terminal domain-containing protein [Treponema sp.]|nr:chitobiase/beta-hexosaminidase C-terminal domain-containing protein [Treponema sp.]
MNKILKKALILISSLAFLSSCQNNLSNKIEPLQLFILQNALSNNNSSENTIEYGSLTIVQDNSRSLEIGSIAGANVTVSGYNMTDINKNSVTVTEGAGDVTIENIPVGSNRVIRIEALTDKDNIESKVAGAVLYAVTDIVAGSNSVTVNWASSAKGAVYYKLLKNYSYDISSLSPSTVQTLLSDQCHASLIDTDSIAKDIKDGTYTSKDSSDYVLSAASLTFTSDVTSSSIKVQVCDPASQIRESISSGTNTITGIAPGSWKIFGLVNGSTVVYSSSSTFASGATVNLGSIQFKTPAPRLENSSGTAISEFISSATTVYLKARTYDGEEEPSGVKIYYTTDGTSPSSSSTLYTSSGISVSVGTTVKAIAICDGLLDSDVSSWTFALPSLGQQHPSSGKYSPVSEADWGSLTSSLGANVGTSTTTFALYSKNATKILLEIYGSAYGADALYDYWLVKGSDDIWRAELSGDLTGAIYAFRCWGPNWTFNSTWTRGGSTAGFISDCDSSGNRFNPNKVLYDPYAREMTHDPSNATSIAAYTSSNSGYALETPVYGIMTSGETYRYYDSATIAPKGYVITDSTSFGTKPAIAQKDAIIYEAHVRGITKHSSTANLSTLLSDYASVSDIPENYRGTYKGATYLIPYLKAIGINTIELLPVHETDNDANPDDGPGGNFWGYMTFDYFAPDRRYSSDKSCGGPTKEFKEMVKAFHDAGMEVYLDVVYNHSGEGGPWNGDTDSNQQCTLVSMRGIDNSTYYSLVSSDKSAYWETSGCGNNLQCDNSYVRQFIIDSLTYWIDTMGVDGFRFDLATVLGREYSSSTTSWDYNASATTTTQIASLGTSKNVEMIAESWDCGGNSYQVGNFPDGWAGWNGYYRDTMRGFVGNATASASISYTDALYGDLSHFGTADPSINFICAHDGFTLADLASYSGAGNYYNTVREWPFGPSDGGNGDQNSISTNIYVNGSLDEPASRRQRIRNYFTMQMFSAGIPMIVYGDEFGRTQNGNNNPYNLDSVATWNNYNMIASSSPQAVSCGSSSISQENGSYVNMLGTSEGNDGKNANFEFAKYVMNERANNASLRQLTGAAFTWYKVDGSSGWGDEGCKKAILINGDGSLNGGIYYMMINMTDAEVTFTVPTAPSGVWKRIIDTGNWAETAYNCWDYSTAWEAEATYGVGPYRIVVMKAGESTPTCASPVISGTDNFTDSTSVTITSTTSGASIYYTTDGTTPSATNGTLYSSAITLTSTTTVKAIAILDGYNNSSVSSSIFTKTSPTVANPVISGTTRFTESTSVTITCSTSGASIYYTTDGSTPSASNGTLYSSAISLTSTTTVKAIGILSGYDNSSVVSKTFTLATSSSKSGVMLQGFNWDSAPRDSDYNWNSKSPYWQKWYGIVTANATQIGNTFEYMWCPPPSRTDTASSEGYAPTLLNDLNNCYGTAAELTAMISAISPAKAIADIVVNHRAGTTSWGDFTEPDWGCDPDTKSYPVICSDDEGFTNTSSPMYGATSTGAADTGASYAAYRDLDHTSSTVQQGIIDWMNNVLKPAGFVGWRYDYVKGYSGNYVGMYDAASDCEFSVGEYWPTDGYSSSNPSSWYNEINSWVSATESGGYKSKVFDFTLKGAMNSVFGCNASSVSNSNYALLADSSNFYISQPEYAVTFVDNHDTGSTQAHWYLDPDDVGTAYALILTHPGYPCVAWQHYFSYAESYTNNGLTAANGSDQYLASNTVSGTSNSLREHIDYLISLRQSLGIGYDSTRTTLATSSSYYAAKITGENGNAIVVIGSGYTQSDSSFTLTYSGDNFAIYTDTVCAAPVISISSGSVTITCATDGATIKYSTDGGSTYSTYSSAFTVEAGTTVKAYASKSGLEDSSVVSKTYTAGVQLTVTADSWTWSGGVKVFAWVWGSSSTGEWIECTGSDTTVNVTVPADTTGLLLVRCPSGTTEPDWEATGDNAGRIYNKSGDITYASGTTSYSTNFSDYSPS